LGRTYLHSPLAPHTRHGQPNSPIHRTSPL
jgi:hypothetical protein